MERGWKEEGVRREEDERREDGWRIEKEGERIE